MHPTLGLVKVGWWTPQLKEAKRWDPAPSKEVFCGRTAQQEQWLPPPTAAALPESSAHASPFTKPNQEAGCKEVCDVVQVGWLPQAWRRMDLGGGGIAWAYSAVVFTLCICIQTPEWVSVCLQNNLHVAFVCSTKLGTFSVFLENLSK